MKIKVAFYDDQLLQTPLVLDLVERVRQEPDCEVQTFREAIKMIEAVLKGYEPHIAVIDISGDKERFEEEIQDAFAHAQSQLNFERFILEDAMRHQGLPDWQAAKYYGIGLLALLRATRHQQCEFRMALTNTAIQSNMVRVLSYNALVNSDVCPKDLETAEYFLFARINEMRDRLAGRRLLSCPYIVTKLKDIDGEYSEGSSQGRGKYLLLKIEEKESGRSGQLELTGVQALVLDTLIKHEGRRVGKVELDGVVRQFVGNYGKEGDKDYVRHSREKWRLIRTKLKGMAALYGLNPIIGSPDGLIVTEGTHPWAMLHAEAQTGHG